MTELREHAGRVVLTVDGRGLAEHRVGVRDLLTVLVHGSELDRRLAAGAAPESGVALALRADRIVRPRARHDLARSLRSMMRSAHRPPPLCGTFISRRRVRAAERELRALCQRLLADGPVSAHGVAQLRLLLTDGRSPLYDGRATEDDRAEDDRAEDLTGRVRRIRNALDVDPQR